MTEFKTGWYPGTSNHDHHRGIYKDCIGSSFLKTFADRSPAHARESVLNADDPTPAMIIGNAFHSTSLGFPDDVIVVASEASHHPIRPAMSVGTNAAAPPSSADEAEGISITATP